MPKAQSIVGSLLLPLTLGLWTLATNTQVGIVLSFNSGFPFNIRSNKDVNGDGTSNNDRPVDVARNDRNLG